MKTKRYNLKMNGYTMNIKKRYFMPRIAGILYHSRKIVFAIVVDSWFKMVLSKQILFHAKRWLTLDQPYFHKGKVTDNM